MEKGAARKSFDQARDVSRQDWGSLSSGVCVQGEGEKNTKIDRLFEERTESRKGKLFCSGVKRGVRMGVGAGAG